MVPVMPAQAGIHYFGRIDPQAVDGRNKPGHDGKRTPIIISRHTEPAAYGSGGLEFQYRSSVGTHPAEKIAIVDQRCSIGWYNFFELR